MIKASNKNNGKTMEKQWKNNGKTMEKQWKNNGKTIVFDRILLSSH